MISKIGGSIRVAGVADAAAIAAVHVEAWRETYVSIVPVQVLAGLSVDRRMEIWRRILTNPTAFSSSAVFVAEREGTVVGFGCCGMQRDESLNSQGYDGEISSIYVLRAFQRCGLGVAPMSATGGELQRRRLQAASLWVLQQNESARRFYEKLGGDIVGDKTDIREDGVVFVEVAYGWRDLGALVQRVRMR
jgi:ribosomal protein S18 acetylase RimI-like enzyme